MEGLARLKPVLPDGMHTAGTSSQISDGAAAVLLDGRGSRARALACGPGRGSWPRSSPAPTPYYLLDGPVDATRKVLTRAG